MISVTYAECPFKWCVILVNVVMLSVVAPTLGLTTNIRLAVKTCRDKRPNLERAWKRERFFQHRQQQINISHNFFVSYDTIGVIVKRLFITDAAPK